MHHLLTTACLSLWQDTRGWNSLVQAYLTMYTYKALFIVKDFISPTFTGLFLWVIVVNSRLKHIPLVCIMLLTQSPPPSRPPLPLLVYCHNKSSLLTPLSATHSALLQINPSYSFYHAAYHLLCHDVVTANTAERRWICLYCGSDCCRYARILNLPQE